MIFSNGTWFKNVKMAVSLFLGAALVVSCSENNTPAVKGSNNATFYVDSLNKIGLVAVGEPNKQGKYDKKLLSLEACMKDLAQTNSLSNLRFDILAGDIAMEKKTDYRGCVQWQELIEFDPDNDVKNVIMNRSLSAKESHSGTDNFMFTVNPIKDDVSGIIRNGTYNDAATTTPVSFKLQQYAMNQTDTAQGTGNVIYVKISSYQSRMARQTEIETLNLESKGVDFHNLKIDQKLNIIFPYKYYTRFSVSLLKQGLDGIAGAAIQKGDFKFYLVVVKENTDISKPQISDILGATQFTASPRGDAGLITVPVVLNFSNITAITNRVNFLFTAVSLDTPARFVDQSFEGFANGLVANKDLAIKLVPNSFNVQPLFDDYMKAQAETDRLKGSVIEALGQGADKIGNPIVKYTVKEGPGTGPEVTKEINFKTVIENLQENQALTFDEKRGICSAYYQAKIKTLGDLDYQNCLVNPSAQLDASISEIVESVDPDVSSSASVMDIETLNMTSSFEITNTKDTANGRSGEASVDGKLGAGFGFCEEKDKGCTKGSPTAWFVKKILQWTTGITPVVEINASVGGKAYVSSKVDNQQVNTDSAKIVKEKALTSLPLMISMNAKVAKCLVIAKKSTTIAASLPDVRYYCSDVRDISRTEYYYLIDYTIVDKTNSVVDIYSGVVNPFHMLVRGKETYLSLKDTLTNKAKPSTFWISKIDESKLQDLSNMTQTAPMVLRSRRGLLK